MQPLKSKKTNAPKVPETLWSALYESANAFYELSPWAFLEESHIFSFQSPTSGKTGYLSVLGEDGEFLGLSIYRGRAGLDMCLEMQSGADISLEDEEVNKYDALILEFTPKKDLDKEEKNLLKKLDSSLSKTPLIPSFRSYLPEFQGWYLNEEEASFFLLALKCAIFHVNACKKDPTIYTSSDSEKFRLYSLKENEWEANWHTPAPLQEKDNTIPLDTRKIERLKGVKLYRDAGWEASVFYTPSVIQDDARPYYARVLMIVHQESLLVLQVKIADPGKSVVSLLGEEILEAIATHKRLPAEIVFNNEELFEGIKPLAKALGVEVALAPFLPATAPAQENLLEHIR